MRRCPSCGKRSESEKQTCKHCGEPLSGTFEAPREKTCPDCSAEVPAGAGFCPECGVMQLPDNKREPGEGPTRCPKCGSERFGRIPLIKKIGMAVLLGPFALPKVRATLQCINCGHEW